MSNNNTNRSNNNKKTSKRLIKIVRKKVIVKQYINLLIKMHKLFQIYIVDLLDYILANRIKCHLFINLIDYVNYYLIVYIINYMLIVLIK
jgi:hypothetical protein